MVDDGGLPHAKGSEGSLRGSASAPLLDAVSLKDSDSESGHFG